MRTTVAAPTQTEPNTFMLTCLTKSGDPSTLSVVDLNGRETRRSFSLYLLNSAEQPDERTVRQRCCEAREGSNYREEGDDLDAQWQLQRGCRALVASQNF